MVFLRTAWRMISVCLRTISVFCEHWERDFCEKMLLFQINDIVWNASVKQSTRFTSNGYVVKGTVTQNCNVDILEPHGSSFAFFNP